MSSSRDPHRPSDLYAQVEVAIGVLMELRGWDATKARFRLTDAAARTDSEVASVAQAILALYP
jgi:hypothetical protein